MITIKTNQWIEVLAFVAWYLFAFTLFECILKFAYNVTFFEQKILYTLFYAFVFGGISSFSKHLKINIIVTMIITTLFAILYVSEATYFRAFNSIALLDALSKLKELNGVKDSITDFITYHVGLFFIPTFLLLAVSIYYRKVKVVVEKNILVSLLVVTCGALFLSISNYYFEFIHVDMNKQTFTNTTLYFKKYGFIETLNKEIYMKMTKQDSEQEYPEMIEEAFTYVPMEHDKTGSLEGKNLVFIQAESFAPYAIDEKLTPTLYKLMQESYNFTNFYSPRPSTNYSEYALLKSFYLTSTKEMKIYKPDGSMPTLFNEKGYLTSAYHNNYGWFYSRDKQMPALGFQDFYASEPLGLETLAESDYISDIDLFKQAYPLFRQPPRTWDTSTSVIDGETSEDVADAETDIPMDEEQGELQNDPFFSYLVTVSAHAPFDVSKRPSMVDQYAEVEKLYPTYPKNIKAYLAGAMVTDQGVEHLMQSLEADGILENTVIVFVGDHYPYALGDANIKQMYGIDSLDTYKVPFMIWDASKPSQEVDALGSNVDVLPTLASLFNLQLDYTMGQDLFSENKDKVIVEWHDVRSYSYLTPKGGYDGETFTVIGEEITDQELDEYEAVTFQREQWIEGAYVSEKLKR